LPLTTPLGCGCAALVGLAFAISTGGGSTVQGENPSAGLISYWSFDDNTADSAWLFTADRGGAEDNLKSVGGSARYAPGKVGRAILLDGQHLNATFSPDVRLAPTYTIEAWIKPTVPARPRQGLYAVWGAEEAYQLTICGTQVSLRHKQEDSVPVRAQGGEVAAGRWQHVAAVADAKSRRLTVYLDGRSVATQPYDGTLLKTSREPLAVGDSAADSNKQCGYAGYLDELAVWNVALTPDQIGEHYRSPHRRFGLVRKTLRQTVLDDRPEGYWQLDEVQGTTVRDASGRGIHGTCRPGVQLGRPGIVSVPDNRAAALDGAGACIDLGDLDAIDGLGAITVEAWIRWEDPGGKCHGVAVFLRKETVLAFGTGWTGQNSASPTVRKARFWINAGGAWLHSDNGTTDVDDGRWHHVAGVYDGDFVRIYVDGIQESCRKIGRKRLSSNANPLMIGSAGGGGEFYPGLIDEVAVYGRALSPTEVYEHYVFGTSE